MPIHAAQNVTYKSGQVATSSGTVAITFSSSMPDTSYTITLAPASGGSNNGLIIATYRLKATNGFTVDTQYIYTQAGKTVYATWDGTVDWIAISNINS